VCLCVCLCFVVFACVYVAGIELFRCVYSEFLLCFRKLRFLNMILCVCCVYLICVYVVVFLRCDFVFVWVLYCLYVFTFFFL